MSTSNTRDDAVQASWPGSIFAITLFVEDLPAAKRWYREVFQLPVHSEDDDSTAFKFGDTLVNLLKASEAPGLVAPAPVAEPDAGVRFQFTLFVDDVDGVVDNLKARGVELLKGRWIDPGGSTPPASAIRPGGHTWEIAANPAS